MDNTPIQGPVFLIEVDKIKPNPFQPRRIFNEDNLKELAGSIREFGILQPIVVTKLEKEGEGGTQVEYYAEDLETIDFNPYRHTCIQTARDLREAAARLKAGKVEAAGLLAIRRLLVNCRSAVAIKGVQIEIERLIFKITKAISGTSLAPPREIVQTICAKIPLLIAGLASIDEQDFRRPVCQPAIERLRTIKSTLAGELTRGAIISKDEVAAAREALKDVSAIL